MTEINFDPAAIQTTAKLLQIAPYGCSEDGAIILKSRFDQLVILIPCGPDNYWIRVYSEPQGLDGAGEAYGSYLIGPLEEILRSTRTDFDEMEVVQGLDLAKQYGLADDDGKVIGLESDTEPEILDSENGKLPVKVIVSMSGGRIEQVLVDREDLDIKVVFTESPKYLDREDEVFIEGSELDGEGIYTVMTAEQGSDEVFTAVIQAAKHYSEETDNG